MPSSTRIRLIEPAEAAPIAAHRVRDAEAFRPWEPAQPDDFFTAQSQAARIEGLLAGYRAGTVWPRVVLAGDEVIGQITVGYWTVTGLDRERPPPRPRLRTTGPAQRKPHHLGRNHADDPPPHPTHESSHQTPQRHDTTHDYAMPEAAGNQEIRLRAGGLLCQPLRCRVQDRIAASSASEVVDDLLVRRDRAVVGTPRAVGVHHLGQVEDCPVGQPM
ncbi:putative acetyltransferase [Streptomyces sp. HCCB10043]|nr:putative acetyltransferase [Streptomyces sp. HCCB10043]EWS90042.1 hypothetical protein SSIG_07556 [Streptomyces filamentosus NRRL 11379]